MSIIRWEQPPSDGRRTTDWSSTANSLRENPGKWALIAENASSRSLAHNIAQGGLAPFRPKGAFKAVARTVNKKVSIYACYVGEDGEYTPKEQV